MDQGKIKDLLENAVDAAASGDWHWVDYVRCELGDACAKEGEKLLNALFASTANNRPERLPYLFPVIAMLCGDRKEGLPYSDIDWSLVSV